MKVNVLKKSKGFLKVEMEGEGHTFGHLMQDALLQDKTVDWAGYDLPHPLFTKPVITVRMKGDSSAEKALERAANKVHSDTEEFIEKFSAAVTAEAEN